MIATRPFDTPRAEQRRRQLIEAAVDAFSEQDYDEVSVDAVAEAAGASHGLAFQYFGSKKGLYTAALEALLERFEETVLLPDPELPTEEMLERALGSYVDWAAEHPAGYRSLMGAAAGMKETRQRVEASRRRGLDRLASGLGLDLDDAIVRIGLRAWIGFMEAAILTWLDEGRPEREDLIALMIASLSSSATALAE